MVEQQTFLWSLIGLAVACCLPIVYLVARLKALRKTDDNRHLDERALLRTVIDNVPDLDRKSVV